MAAPTSDGFRRRSRTSFVLLIAGAALGVVALLALGTWQVHRLTWKLDLIARVDARVHATPASPPGPMTWGTVSADSDAYLRVVIRGRYLDGGETLVQAVTESGAGYWVLAPFRADDGFTVLINRGFVPQDRRDPASRRAGDIRGETTVTGLLRTTEPGGGFLRSNDPAADRWYSRDVAAIATKRSLGTVAPFFIDADATPNAGGLPVGGLTVIAFPNNHLVYAVTWYVLALMLAGAIVWMVREEIRPRSSSLPRTAVVRNNRSG